MAKALSLKSRVIRDALAAHQGMGNTELAETINHMAGRKEDGLTVTPMEVAAQKQALKKAAENPSTAAPPPRASSTAAPSPVLAAPEPTLASPVDLIDKVFDLAKETGGFGALKRLVDRLAEIQGR